MILAYRCRSSRGLPCAWMSALDSGSKKWPTIDITGANKCATNRRYRIHSKGVEWSINILYHYKRSKKLNNYSNVVANKTAHLHHLLNPMCGATPRPPYYLYLGSTDFEKFFWISLGPPKHHSPHVPSNSKAQRATNPAPPSSPNPTTPSSIRINRMKIDHSKIHRRQDLLYRR